MQQIISTFYKSGDSSHLRRCQRVVTVTYFVYHVGYQALHLIRIDRLSTTAHSNGSLKFGERYTCAPNRGGGLLFGLLESASEEYLAKEITQGNITTPLQSKVDSTLNKLIFTLLECEIEGSQVSLADALC